MSKFITLVFKTDTQESVSEVREMAANYNFTAGSMDHEIYRLELIEQALDNNDIDLAKKYIHASDVSIFLESDK